MARVRFDLDEKLDLFNFESLSFEKTKNSPIIPVLRGKGALTGADNFTFNDYFELKFIIKKDARYDVVEIAKGFDELVHTKTALSELEKVYKIYSLYRTKTLVFLENADLFKKLFPGTQKFKMGQAKTILNAALEAAKTDLRTANTTQDKVIAKEALDYQIQNCLTFFQEYFPEFQSYEVAKNFFGYPFYLTNNNTVVTEDKKNFYLTEVMFNKFSTKQLETVTNIAELYAPFITMLNRFSITSIPGTSDGFEVTFGFHYFDDVFTSVVTEKYKTEKNSKVNKKFYDDIEGAIRGLLVADDNFLKLDIYNIDKTSLETSFSPEELKKKNGTDVFFDFNSFKSSIEFPYTDIAQFEIISYFNIAEVPIQGRTKPLKQNLGIGSTTLSLRFLSKDTTVDSFTKSFNDLQYFTELEQRKLRTNIYFPFLNALDFYSVELSDFHYSNDTESDGSIATAIFSCSGYQYSPDKNNSTLAVTDLGRKSPKENVYYTLFYKFLHGAFQDLVSGNGKRVASIDSLVFDTGVDGDFTFLDLGSVYLPGNGVVLDDLYKAKDTFATIYTATTKALIDIKTGDYLKSKISFVEVAKKIDANQSTKDKVTRNQKAINELETKIKANQETTYILKTQSDFFGKNVSSVLKGSLDEKLIETTVRSSFERFFKVFFDTVCAKRAFDKVDQSSDWTYRPALRRTYEKLLSECLLFFADKERPLGRSTLANFILEFSDKHLIDPGVLTFKNCNFTMSAKTALSFSSNVEKLKISTKEKSIASIFSRCITGSYESFLSTNYALDFNLDFLNKLEKQNNEYLKQMKELGADTRELLNGKSTTEILDVEQWYSNFQYMVNSMFPTMVVEDSFTAGDDTDIIRNEFMKIAMLDYLVNFPEVFDKTRTEKNFENKILKTLEMFRNRLNDDVLLTKAIEVFETNAELNTNFFNKGNYNNLKKTFDSIRGKVIEEINGILKTLEDEIKEKKKPKKLSDLEKPMTGIYATLSNVKLLQKLYLIYNYEATSGGVPSFVTAHLEKKIKTVKTTAANVVVESNPFVTSFGIAFGNKSAFMPYTEANTLSKEGFKKVINSYDTTAEIVLAFFAPLALKFSFAAAYYGMYANEAAKRFVTPFENTFATLSFLPEKFSLSEFVGVVGTHEYSNAAINDSFLTGATYIFGGKPNALAAKTDISKLHIKNYFLSLINKVELKDLTFKDNNSYCNIKLKDTVTSPLKLFLENIDFIKKNTNPASGSAIVANDIAQKLLTALDSTSRKTTTQLFLLENSLDSKEALAQYKKDFYGFSHQDNVYSAAYADNEHLFFDSENASAMANSATSARVAMNGNSGVIKSNFNNLFTHDLVDCMPTYSIFIMKNGKNLYNANGMFQVQSLEAMYGVDKITDISVQFSEETRVKTCLFNVVDDSTSYSAFGFETDEVLSTSFDTKPYRVPKQTLEIGDCICVYMGNVFGQKPVFNGTINSISEGRYRQVTCVSYANELLLKSFNIARSEGEYGFAIIEKLKDFFKVKMKSTLMALGNTKKILVNPNDHIIPSNIKCIVEPSVNPLIQTMNFTEPSTCNKDTDECSAYSLIFEGLANSYETMKHFKNFKDLQSNLNFSDANANMSMSGIWGRDQKSTGNIKSNIIKNVNNVDRDLSYYGVELVGDFSEEITKYVKDATIEDEEELPSD